MLMNYANSGQLAYNIEDNQQLAYAIGNNQKGRVPIWILHPTRIERGRYGVCELSRFRLLSPPVW